MNGLPAALLLAALSHAPTVDEGRRTTAATALDSILTDAARHGFMGSVLVVRGSRVLLDRAEGFADLARRRRDTPGTRYQIGSVTKQFTAAAILVLQQQGTLRLSDPVTRWLPEAAPRWSAVTVHQLLTHTGGIPDSDFDAVTTSRHAGGRDASWPIALAMRRPLDFAPGSRFAYSNTGYLVLGQIIERASHTRYEAFVREHLLEPLGLHDTGFDRGDGARDAEAYTNRRGRVERPPGMDLRPAHAAGGLWSTTSDLVRWERALYGGCVLADSSLAMMTAPAIGDYACGIHHRRSPGREVIYHTGRTWGFESVLGWYPQDSVAIAVLTNMDGSRPNVLYDALANAAHAPAAAAPDQPPASGPPPRTRSNIR